MTVTMKIYPLKLLTIIYSIPFNAHKVKKQVWDFSHLILAFWKLT